MSATLSHAEARAFYDRFGAKQDWQRIYENRAVSELLDHAALGSARHVVEFGCGTGALARELLAHRLPREATYLGVDISGTMVALARARVAPWAERARVAQTAGDPAIPVADGTCDRFVSTYVLDLLSDEDIGSVLRDARRTLAPGGLLCLASLTFGEGAMSNVICALWRSLHAWRPALVGGCRPLRLVSHVGPEWSTLHQRVVCTVGLCTEVVVARR